MLTRNWKRSSKCDNSGPNCLEVAKVGDMIAVRNSNTGHVVHFTEEEWNAFLFGAKNNEFDL